MASYFRVDYVLEQVIPSLKTELRKSWYGVQICDSFHMFQN